MCGGVAGAQEPSPRFLKEYLKGNKRKRINSLEGLDGKAENEQEIQNLGALQQDNRKEKSRDAARNRRAKESDYFQELENLLPVTGTPPNSQMTSIDKTSLIRLSVAYLQSRSLVANGGIHIHDIKEELQGCDVDILRSLNGFGLVLSDTQEVVYVSNNVSDYIGLTSFELLGQSLSDFIHPCDHPSLKDLIPNILENQDKHVMAYVRIKCTITERGRMINLKQANYKVLRIEGRVRRLPSIGAGGLTGRILMGIATLINTEMILECGKGSFITKHKEDMKMVDEDGWLTEDGGYSSTKLSGRSFFDLVHAQDIQNILQPFKNLREHGQCETGPYRLLLGGGGYAWVQTRAVHNTPRRGSSKTTSITCQHSLITESLESETILALVQTEAAGDAVKPRLVETLEMGVDETFDLENPENMNEILEMLEQDAEELKMMDEEKKVKEELEKMEEEEKVEIEEQEKEMDQMEELNVVFELSPMEYQDLLADHVTPDMSSVSINTSPPRTSVIMSREGAKLTPVTAQLFVSSPESTWSSGSPVSPQLICEDILPSPEPQVLGTGRRLSSDLEKLSPFIGDECVPLNKTETLFQPINLDSFDDLEFTDDIFDLTVNTDGIFYKVDNDEDSILLEPQTKIMWGGSQDSGISVSPRFDPVSPNLLFSPIQQENCVEFFEPLSFPPGNQVSPCPLSAPTNLGVEFILPEQVSSISASPVPSQKTAPMRSNPSQQSYGSSGYCGVIVARETNPKRDKNVPLLKESDLGLEGLLLAKEDTWRNQAERRRFKVGLINPDINFRDEEGTRGTEDRTGDAGKADRFKNSVLRTLLVGNEEIYNGKNYCTTMGRPLQLAGGMKRREGRPEGLGYEKRRRVEVLEKYCT